MNRKPDVIALTDIYPKNSSEQIHNCELNIDGYQMFLPERCKENGRGVVIYLRNGIAGSLVDLDENFDESVWIQITLDKTYILFGCIYRSPSSESENNVNLCKLLEKSCEKDCTHYVVLGDFNYKEIDWNSNMVEGRNLKGGQAFLNCINDLFLYQHV